MSARRRKNQNIIGIAILGMLALILILALVIGFLLIRRALDNPLKDVEVFTADYIDATGTITGKRGYINIPKSRLTSASEKEFGKFTEEVVNTGEYAVFSIICDDGTGLVFRGDPVQVAQYGYIDAMGQTTETFGYVEYVGDTYRYVANMN